MASEVGICNVALRKVGGARISSLSDNSEEARACADLYEPLRDAMLRAHAWNFAIARATLAALATPTPAWGYTAYYQLPVDCMRVIEVQYKDDWSVEQRYLALYDTGTANIRYIQKITDANQFDPLFRDALAARLAMELVEPLSASNSKRDRAAEALKEALVAAYLSDAVEGTPEDLDDGDWLNARH